MGSFIESITNTDGSVYGIVDQHTPYYSPEDRNLYGGSVRTNCGGLEYYDAQNSCWLPLPGCDVRLEIGSHYQQVLDWAMQKMHEEKEKQLLEKYPALSAAKKNYELVKAMVENE